MITVHYNIGKQPIPRGVSMEGDSMLVTAWCACGWQKGNTNWSSCTRALDEHILINKDGCALTRGPLSGYWLRTSYLDAERQRHHGIFIAPVAHWDWIRLTNLWADLKEKWKIEALNDLLQALDRSDKTRKDQLDSLKDIQTAVEQFTNAIEGQP